MAREIQRFCWFDTVPLDTGKLSTIWKYKRAIEGHKLILVNAEIVSHIQDVSPGAGNRITFQVYDGHTYSHWGAYPNIFDQSTLGIVMLNHYVNSGRIELNHWECKEVTISAGLTSEDEAKRFGLVLYFYEVPMSKTEILEYAVKQPRYKYRHGSARTLDRFED